MQPDRPSSASTQNSKPLDGLTIIRAHFPPEHLIAQDEIAKSHNLIQYDRSLTEVDKHRIAGHMEHVEQYGLMYDIEVPAKEREAWSWADPYLRKEADRG